MRRLQTGSSSKGGRCSLKHFYRLDVINRSNYLELTWKCRVLFSVIVTETISNSLLYPWSLFIKKGVPLSSWKIIEPEESGRNMGCMRYIHTKILFGLSFSPYNPLNSICEVGFLKETVTNDFPIAHQTNAITPCPNWMGCMTHIILSCQHCCVFPFIE